VGVNYEQERELRRGGGRPQRGEQGLWHHSPRQKPSSGRRGGGGGSHDDFPDVEIWIAGGVGEKVRANYCDRFFFFLFFFFSFFSFFSFFLNHLHLFKVQRQHPLSPLHTRRLKSQHDEIITTFPNSTPRYEFALGGGVIPALHSPSFKFIPLGFLHSGLMDFVFF